MNIFKNTIYNIFGEEINLDENKPQLEKEFLIPPFSVFDTKQGYWQDRKKEWLKLGIKSELGRDKGLTFNLGSFNYNKEKEKIKNGEKGENTTSIFDPVLCEICYRWFNIKNGKVLDPFAGGSVRGIVAKKLGYDYVGIDLRNEQVLANYENAKELDVNPIWYCDDSKNVDMYLENKSVDLIFSCPPYFDLEVYSDNENDLSNMNWEDFKKNYKEIISKCCCKLKDDSFAVFVVGDIRDKNGYYRNFVDYTKKCFNDCGLLTYNEIILLQTIGTASVRCRKSFNSTRKITKTHQNVLVFYKGNINNIKHKFGEINIIEE